jgi:hypothetical protein
MRKAEFQAAMLVETSSLNMQDAFKRAIGEHRDAQRLHPRYIIDGTAHGEVTRTGTSRNVGLRLHRRRLNNEIPSG